MGSTFITAAVAVFCTTRVLAGLFFFIVPIQNDLHIKSLSRPEAEI